MRLASVVASSTASNGIASALPALHGAPVHVGDPAAIGVRVDRPLDTIGTPSIADDEVPVFWACGVTAQEAVARAAPPVVFTHVSSRMLVTDLRIDDATAPLPNEPPRP